jgi:hypothetical protein
MPGGRLVRMDCSSACRSLTLFELRATFLYGHNARADVERPMSGWHQKGPPAVVEEGPEITSKTAAKIPSSWYYIGKGTSESAAVDVEVGISLYGAKAFADVFVVQDYSSTARPLRRAGCFNSAFFAYLPAKT